MTSDFVFFFVLPALINVACTAAVLALSIRSERVAIAAALLLLVVASFVFARQLLTCDYSLSRLLVESGALMAAVWVPGATLAVLASRSSTGSRCGLTIAALLTALVCGAAFPVFFVAVIYFVFGDFPRSLGAVVC